MREAHHCPRPAMTVTCRVCGPTCANLYWKPTANGAWHLGARCSIPRCRRWIAWLPQTPAMLAIAPPRPGSLDESIAIVRDYPDENPLVLRYHWTDDAVGPDAGDCDCP